MRMWYPITGPWDEHGNAQETRAKTQAQSAQDGSRQEIGCGTGRRGNSADAKLVVNYFFGRFLMSRRSSNFFMISESARVCLRQSFLSSINCPKSLTAIHFALPIFTIGKSPGFTNRRGVLSLTLKRSAASLKVGQHYNTKRFYSAPTGLDYRAGH